MASLSGSGAIVCLLLAILIISYSKIYEDILWENLNVSSNGDVGRPEITTPQGRVKGVNMVSHHNRTIFGFMGIPFAQPPVGDLRFRPPIPANAWNGTLDAGSDSRQCPQFSDFGVFLGDEDCLYLNVYTPQLPASNGSTLLPVMLYVVGGLFGAEIISPERYSPKFLLDKDMLLVIPNFRVGVLGFLTTGDEVSSGNQGLKDIVCSLEWVQRNIQYYGGDPNQVTLGGGSSGGVSVHLLTMSDSTKGLFHRYITQGGTALSSGLDVTREEHVNRAYRLGGYLGCPTNTSTLLVNCLRDISPEKLFNANSRYHVWKRYPGFLWLPTSEPDIEGALLTDTPANLVAAGKVRDVPWINGISRDDGLVLSIAYYEDPDLFEDFLANIDLALPYMLGYWAKVDGMSAHTAALKSFYFRDLTADRSLLLENLTQLVGDSLIIYSAYNSLQRQLAFVKSPQYYYSFEYRGTFSYGYIFSPSRSTEYRGIVHGDDLIYLFGSQGERLTPPGTEFSEDDLIMVDKMVELWTSFIINGTPTMPKTDSTITWEPYSSLKNYLRIGNQFDTALEIKYDVFSERMLFWDQLMAATTT